MTFLHVWGWGRHTQNNDYYKMSFYYPRTRKTASSSDLPSQMPSVCVSAEGSGQYKFLQSILRLFQGTSNHKILTLGQAPKAQTGLLRSLDDDKNP